MARESEAANFRGTAVEDVEENAFAGFYVDGITVAQHAAVDGEKIVADFIAVGHALGERSFHGGLASRLQLFVGRGRSEKIHGHVSTAAEGWLKFLEDKKNFAVVVAGFVFRLDVYGANLAGVLAGVEIGSGAIVGVIKAKAGGSGSEDDAPHAARGNEGRAFLGGTVDIGR